MMRMSAAIASVVWARKDPRAAASLAALLPNLPEELWLPAGELLHRLTGQDFGPHPGDKLHQVRQARAKWQTWLATQYPN